MVHSIHGITALHPTRCCLHLVCLQAWRRTRFTRLEWWLRTDLGMAYHHIEQLKRKTQVTDSKNTQTLLTIKLPKYKTNNFPSLYAVDVYCQFISFQPRLCLKAMLLRVLDNKQFIWIKQTHLDNKTRLSVIGMTMLSSGRYRRIEKVGRKYNTENNTTAIVQRPVGSN